MIETAQPGRDAPAASRDWPEHSLAADSLALFAGFFLLALGAIAVARQPGTVAVVWIANGAATAFIVSAPRERAWRLCSASWPCPASPPIWPGAIRC